MDDIKKSENSVFNQTLNQIKPFLHLVYYRSTFEKDAFAENHFYLISPFFCHCIFVSFPDWDHVFQNYFLYFLDFFFVVNHFFNCFITSKGKYLLRFILLEGILQLFLKILTRFQLSMQIFNFFREIFVLLNSF